MTRTYKTPSVILSKAADDVEQNWVQGALMCAQGKRCAVGAMAYYSGDLEVSAKPPSLVEEGEVIEMAFLRISPSSGFNQALAYAAKEINPKSYKELYDEWKMYNEEDEVRGTFANFADEYYNSFMDMVIDTNDAGGNIYGTVDKRKVPNAHKKVIKVLRKAAEKAKADKR